MAITVKVAGTQVVPVGVSEMEPKVPVRTDGAKVFGGFDTRLWKPHEDDGSIAWELSSELTPPEPISVREKLIPGGNLSYNEDGRLAVSVSEKVQDGNELPVSSSAVKKALDDIEPEALTNSDIEELIKHFV